MNAAPTATLDGWRRAPFTGAGMTYDCFEKGSGPGVVLIPEIPGITPEVLGLAEHLVGSGFTVVVPSPFGEPGRPLTVGYAIRQVARLCVSSEFRAFAVGAHRPITDFFRAVASDLAERTPGSLALAVDDSVRASVLSQPGMPLPIGRARRVDATVSPAEFDRVAERAAAGDVCALGLRFSEDGGVPRERFATISARLGDAFEVIELDSSQGNAGGFRSVAHSVLTAEMREEPGHPAFEARERVVAFLAQRLAPALP